MQGQPPSICPRPRHILATALAGGLTLAVADALFSDLLVNGGKTPPGIVAGQLLASASGFVAVLAAVGMLAYGAIGRRPCTVVASAMERAGFAMGGLVALAGVVELVNGVQASGTFALRYWPIVAVVLLPLLAGRLSRALLPGGVSAQYRRRILLAPVALAVLLAGAVLVVGTAQAGLWWKLALGAGLVGTVLAAARALSRRPRVAYSVAGFGAVIVVLGALAVLPRAGFASRARAAGPGGATGGKIRRVILLTVDTLRRDALDVYAASAPPTPALRGLASDSVVFDQAISPAPWTLPAFASMHTGVLPDVHRATRFDRALPAALPTLAERMRAAGYQTAAFGYNIFLSPTYQLDRGFGRYEMFPKPAPGSVGGRIVQRLMPDRFGVDHDAADITRMSLDWIRRHQHEPFFLWVHYFDPHLPYAPPAKYVPAGPPPARIGTRCDLDLLESVRSGYFVPTQAEVAWLRALYDGEVRYVDAQIGRLLGALRQMGLYDDTLIVFTSDHGEEFWEHGGFEHGHSVYDELIRVPLFVKLPAPGVHMRAPEAVSSVAITPTVLELCGLPLEPGRFSAGSLAACWGEPAGDSRDRAAQPVIATGCAYYENRTAVRFGAYKHISTELSQQEQLFDLASDPGERSSISPKAAQATYALARELLAAHQGAAAALRAHFRAASEDAVAEIGEAQLRGLRTLGYVE